MKDDHVFYSAVHPHEGQRRFVLRGLDGVRAIAVLLVLVYHFWPQYLPGGMIGVDLFFVISGYLITALLLREGAYTGKMDIVSFWVRRLRRLVPAFALLTLVVGSLALLVGGDAQVGLGRQILGAFTYSSNWLLIWAGNDYFTQTSPELMTNFWSLAVEEQFYLFWPVVMVFVFMFTAKWWQRALVPGVLGALSLLAAVVLGLLGASTTRLYYGTDTHLYGLMLGVLLAMMIPWSMYPPVDNRLYPLVGYGNGIWGWLRQLVGWVSLVAVIPFALTLSDHSSWLMPWGLLVGSLLGMGIIQALLPDVRGGTSGLFRGLLSLAPLRWIGQRSYGIYLWHWPLMVLAHYTFGAARSSWVNVGVLFLTLIIAGLSYMYVEQPVRHLGFRGALSAWFSAMVAPAGRALPVGAAVLAGVTLIATVFAVRTAPAMTQAEAVVAAGANYAQASAPAPQPTTASAAPSSSASPSASAEPTESASPSPASSTTPSANVDGSQVTIVGDSVTLASSIALGEAMPQALVNAEVSRTSAAALPVVEQMVDSGQMREVLVLSVTANSTFTVAQLEQLKASVSPNGERKIVLVTGVGPANLTWIEPSNQVIREFATQNPDTVFVADWQAAAKGHPEYLVSDGVHPQNEGLTVYAQTVKDAVAKALEN
ncbi:acyltransferase family protein [Rothia nasimurium]|uniref:acyltransferase family protein n=1 Tax=Rothia nasimurium TaxID=85336 RepID=UPI001F384075|nr:acyltransferase family protein [Rothia nasimurium]